MKLSTIVGLLFTITTFVAGLPISNAPSILQSRTTYVGRGTWYDVDTSGEGACGKWNNNNQPIIAMNHVQYNRNICGKWITLKNTKNGRTARGYVEDMCPGCPKGGVDMSPSLFEQLASLGTGVVTVSWVAPSTKRSVDESVERSDDHESADEYDFDPAMELTAEDLEDISNTE